MDRTPDVLATARRLFAAGGYEALNLDAVAAEAAVSRSWLYARYPDRTALLVAIVEAQGESFFRQLAASLRPSDDLTAMLRQSFALFVDFVAENRSEYVLLFGPATNLEPEVAERMAGLRERMAEAYVALFNPAIEAEGLARMSHGEALIVAHSIIGMAEGAVHAWLSNDMQSREELVDSAVRLMRGALLGPTGGER